MEMQQQGSNNFSLTQMSQALLAIGCLMSPTVWADASASEVMVVTASQTEHPELTAPASVSFIDSEALSKMAVTDLSEAISRLPGINVNPAATYGRNEIKIRGLDADYTLLLINGRRINSRDALTSAYGNDFDLSSVPLAAIERIEVIRGPMSSLYGADALGGVVNVILKQPSETTQASVSYLYDNPTEGEGGDSQKASVYASGSIIPDLLAANIIVETNQRDAWRTDLSINPDTDVLEERDELNIYSSLKWTINAQQDVDVELIHSQDDRDADWNNWGRAVTNVQELERTNIAVTHNGAWAAFDSRVRVSIEDVDLMDDSELNVAVGHVTQQNSNADLQLSGYLGEHLLTGGVEYSSTELENNLTLAGGPVDYSRSAVYLQDEFAIGDLNFTLGGRFDDHEVYGGEFSPRAYAVYSLSDNWIVKGGVGKAFKAPSLNQYSDAYAVLACRGACYVVGNPDLKAETATTYELSTSYQAEGWGGSVTLFNNAIEDMIQAERWDRVATELSYFNVDEAQVKGAELITWVNLGDAVQLSANYLYSDAVDKTSDSELTLTPAHSANVQLNWQLLDNLSTNVAYKYTGTQYVRVDEKSAAFGLVDLGVQYQALQGLTVKLGVSNLLDEERDEVATKYDYILKSRSVYAGLTYDFL
uniref:TonB-dependent receptor domain-containing protein n=1 Tax=Thaumasiovibrio occultus TaxID=1891184 RepID=UPI00192CE97E|nr:TonB-dependent receptor [Thaumasiovibrio occultus]